MASPIGPHQIARSDSQTATAISETDEGPSEQPNRPRPRRGSSIRFSRDTNTESRSPMSNRRDRQPSSDEITPIRHADGHVGRTYNTNDSQDATQNAQETHRGNVKAPADNTAKGASHPDDRLPWYKRLAEKYGAVSLENKGSVARDHLALERTFLAWLRTSLAFASIGIAVTQLFRLNTSIASQRSEFEPILASYLAASGGDGLIKRLPFSPLVGHSLPVEVLEAISEQSDVRAARQLPPDVTLLDQLLNPPLPFLSQASKDTARAAAFNEDAAAKLRHVGKPLGATFLGVSIVVLFVGFHRYFEAQHWIMKGKFPASRGSVAFIGFIAGALMLASLIVVLVIAPTSFTKK